MKKRFLGQTAIEVTELCFGALPLGPLQANIPVEDGAKLICNALNEGINFIDTAEFYRTYPYIKRALEMFQGEVIIASKSMAVTYEGMEKSIQGALLELGREYLDIFHLHAAKAASEVFEERAGAWQCLKDYQKKGIIRAIGISTHVVDVVYRAAEIKEVDIIFPIINKLGMGIIGGSSEDMSRAINKASEAGKGLYAMKALAGGHLIHQLKESFDFVRNIQGISSVAVGMVRPEELDVNIKLFNDEEVSQDLMPPKTKSKKLFAMSFCKGCGTCVDICPNHALSIENGKVVVDRNLCLLCGYCNPACPEFALRLV